MKAQCIFLNLPVADVKNTRAFWMKLGFQFNEKFSDENALSMVIKDEHIYAMFLNKDFFQSFTDRKVSDTTNPSAIYAVQVESKTRVEQLVKLALENGGSNYSKPTDMGWMYYETFVDPDGFHWEILYIDETKIPPII